MRRERATSPSGTGAFDSTEEAVGFASDVLQASTRCSIVSVDLRGTILLWNEGARLLYGYGPSEILGKNKAVLHPRADAQRGLPREMMDAALRDGIWEGTIHRLRKDGSEFTARVALTPRRDGEGKVTGYLLVSTDISDELDVREQVQRAEAYSRQLLESAPDAIIGVGPDGRIRLSNSQVQTLFGYRAEELIGEPVEKLVPERFHAAHVSHRAGYFDAPRTRSMGTAGLELLARRKDGSEFPCEISLSSTQSPEGPIAVAAVRDVTAHKRSESELQQAIAELERAKQAKDTFLAKMSHELRTPLNAILGFTGTLLMELPGELNDDQRDQLQTVQTNGRHLLSIINDLLDVAKIESGKVEIELAEIDCAEVAAEVVEGLRPLAEQKGLDFDLVMPPHLHSRSDRRALSQILINLLNNAIKFTERGRIELAIEGNGRGSEARFRVSDTGPGIHPEDGERLFEPFEQSISADVNHRGTGLGLYISTELATLIGGEISFESELGKGTAFTLVLRPDDAGR